MKMTEMMVDGVRISRSALRPADHRASKAQQTRNSRRKIREFLRVGDWYGEA